MLKRRKYFLSVHRYVKRTTTEVTGHVQTFVDHLHQPCPSPVNLTLAGLLPLSAADRAGPLPPTDAGCAGVGARARGELLGEAAAPRRGRAAACSQSRNNLANTGTMPSKTDSLQNKCPVYTAPAGKINDAKPPIDKPR